MRGSGGCWGSFGRLSGGGDHGCSTTDIVQTFHWDLPVVLLRVHHEGFAPLSILRPSLVEGGTHATCDGRGTPRTIHFLFGYMLGVFS